MTATLVDPASYTLIDPDKCLVCEGKAAPGLPHLCEGCVDNFGDRFTYTRSAREIGEATAMVSAKMGVSIATAQRYVRDAGAVVDYSHLFTTLTGAICGCLLERPGYVWQCGEKVVPVRHLDHQPGDPWCVECLLMEFTEYEDRRFGYKSGTLYDAFHEQIRDKQVTRLTAEIEGLSLDEIIEAKLR